ncbi:phage tail protein [Hufsiella ginkgonis]|uniref:Phage tail protein n=1 Tax=Hufsiella ginkgonis TaxID=2695274 RepID=A0A7K1Y1C6_9SPHI|nr:tail fiber protein [Hufsiella ginkgonis]MXV17050.1 phage tail protein [Hufsiella ginkgonis]
MDAYIGLILPWAGTYAPPGWVMCDGRLLQISQYTAVFALFGVNYGGDGRTTFGVPNLIGRLPVGQGQSAGTSTYVLGEMDGAEKVQLTLSTMPAHNHTGSVSNIPLPPPVVSVSVVDADAHVPAPAANTIAPLYNVAALAEIAGFNSGPADTQLNVGQSTATISSTPVSIGLTGANLPFSVMQPYQVINYIVCLEGFYPPRN